MIERVVACIMCMVKTSQEKHVTQPTLHSVEKKIKEMTPRQENGLFPFDLFWGTLYIRFGFHNACLSSS